MLHLVSNSRGDECLRQASRLFKDLGLKVFVRSQASASAAIALAQAAWQGFYLSMGEVREPESRWWIVAECILWVLVYFSAVWIFNALLPPKPEQTPFEKYLGRQLSGAQTQRDQQLDDGTVNQRRPGHQQWH